MSATEEIPAKPQSDAFMEHMASHTPQAATGEEPYVQEAMRDVKLPSSSTWHQYDLEDEATVKGLAAKMHHNTGSHPWQNFSKQLRVAKVPQKLYDAVREHCEGCDRTRTTAPRPLSRPSAFPMATAPFEVLMIDFFYWRQVEVLHIIDASSRYSVLKILKSQKKGKPMEDAESVI